MEKLTLKKKKSMFFTSMHGCANTTAISDKTALRPNVGEGV